MGLCYLLDHSQKIGFSCQNVPHLGCLPGTHLNAQNLSKGNISRFITIKSALKANILWRDVALYGTVIRHKFKIVGVILNQMTHISHVYEYLKPRHQRRKRIWFEIQPLAKYAKQSTYDIKWGTTWYVNNVKTNASWQANLYENTSGNTEWISLRSAHLTQTSFTLSKWLNPFGLVH